MANIPVKVESPIEYAVGVDLSGLDLRSADSLFESAVSLRKSGELKWICLSGLCSDSKKHRAFCRAIWDLAEASGTRTTMPRFVVLDWTQASTCSADGIAFFLVLVRSLVEKGTMLIVCSPTHIMIEDALQQSGVRARCGETVHWVAGKCAGVRGIDPVANAVVFERGDDRNIGPFLDELSNSLSRLGLAKDAKQKVMGLTQEVVQNVRSYANADQVAASALHLRRRKIIQIGIADDGVGIADSILRQERHADLDWFSDASIAALVLRRKLSGRDEAEDGSVSGGGMSRMIPVVLEGVTATIFLRSGRALLELRSDAEEYMKIARLNFARGTQFRLELTLPPG